MNKTKTWENIKIIQLKEEQKILNSSSSIKLIYVLSGQVEVVSDDYSMTFSLGEFFVIPNYSFINMIFSEKTSRVYLIELAYKLVDMSSDKIEIFSGDSKSKGEAGSSTLSQALGKILRLYYLEREVASYWEVNALYFQIISKLEQKYLIRVEKNSNILSTEAVANYIENNLSEDLSLEDLSNVFYVSTQSLARFFKKFFKQPFGKYLQEKRFEQLETLLLDTSHPINQLVYEVGFKNLNSFNRLFKKKYGKSPKEWRQSHRKKRTYQESLDNIIDFGEFQSFIEPDNRDYFFDAHRLVKTTRGKILWTINQVDLLGDYRAQQKLKSIKGVLNIEWIRFSLDLDLRDEKFYSAVLTFLNDNKLKSHLVIHIKGISQNNRLLSFFKILYSYYGNEVMENWQIEFTSTEIDIELLSEYNRLFHYLKNLLPRVVCGFGTFNIYGDKSLFLDLLDNTDFKNNLDFLVIDSRPLVKSQSKYSARENIVLSSDIDYVTNKVDDFLNLVQSKVKHLSVILAAFNLTADNLDDINDSAYKAGYVLAFLMRNEAKFAMVGVSLFDKFYLEDYQAREFNGASGMFTKSGLPKITFFAYYLRSHLQPLILGIEGNLLVSSDGYDHFAILAFHHQRLNDYYSSSKDIVLKDKQNYIFETQTRTIQLNIENVMNGSYLVSFYIIGPGHGNAIDEVHKYTALKQLDDKMIQFLMNRIQPTIYQKEIQVHDNKLVEKLILKPLEVLLIDLTRIKK